MSQLGTQGRHVGATLVLCDTKCASAN